MAKSKTKVINKTGADVILKLSTGGIISKLSDEPLQNGCHYLIAIDLNTTYREYWCAVQPNTKQDKPVILSSDDCAEYSEVTLTTEIVSNSSGKQVPRYKWEGTKCRVSKKTKTGTQRPSSSTSTQTTQTTQTTPVNNVATGAQGSTFSTQTTLNGRAYARPKFTQGGKCSHLRCTIL